MNRTGITKRGWVALVIVVALVAGGSSAVANHVFPDSTDGQAFHEQVGIVAGAGCTTGFPDGTFRPQDNVNRQQFAAWINRCGGRVSPVAAGGTDLTTSGVTGDVGSFARIRSGATGTLATGGFVQVNASVTARVNDPADNDCPCFVQARLEDRTDNATGPFASAIVLPGLGNDIGDGVTTLALTGTFPIGPDETKEFGVEGIFFDADVAGVEFAIQLTALYVPFGPDGDNTLAFEP